MHYLDGSGICKYDKLCFQIVFNFEVCCMTAFLWIDSAARVLPDYIFLFISYFEGDESRSPGQEESVSNASNQSKDIFGGCQGSCAQEVFRTVHERNWKVAFFLQDPASARVTL